jgi:CPA2 family monovalent cation:H+ antiporter-2
MVSVTIVILFVTPYMIKVAPVLALFFQKIFSSKSYGMSKVQDDSIKPDIFILGFGPAGQEVARQLRENYIERIRVFDLNKTSINKAQSMGLSAKVGDVRQMEILQHYGMSNAKLVIITIPSQEAALQTVDIVRRLAPCAHIQLRARYQIHLHNFESAGVHDVVDEEHTVGKAIGERASLFLQDLDTKTNDSNLSPESE